MKASRKCMEEGIEEKFEFERGREYFF